MWLMPTWSLSKFRPITNQRSVGRPTKLFHLSGASSPWSPGQGHCSWTQLGAPTTDLHDYAQNVQCLVLLMIDMPRLLRCLTMIASRYVQLFRYNAGVDALDEHGATVPDSASRSTSWHDLFQLLTNRNSFLCDVECYCWSSQEKSKFLPHDVMLVWHTLWHWFRLSVRHKSQFYHSSWTYNHANDATP